MAANWIISNVFVFICTNCTRCSNNIFVGNNRKTKKKAELSRPMNGYLKFVKFIFVSIGSFRGTRLFLTSTSTKCHDMAFQLVVLYFFRAVYYSAHDFSTKSRDLVATKYLIAIPLHVKIRCRTAKWDLSIPSSRVGSSASVSSTHGVLAI